MRINWRLLVSLVIVSWLLTFKIFAGEYLMPTTGNDLIGYNYMVTVKNGDSLNSIRQEHGISYEELLDANPKIDLYKLKVGQKLFISKQFILPPFRTGIVVNIPELRLYYFTPDGRYVFTFPVGLGRPNWRTPLLNTRIIRKQAEPTWYVPDSIRNHIFKKTGELLPKAVLPGPDNPLGQYALYLSKRGYLIHGTNAPHSVGTFISSGCMRLLKKPMETLYHRIAIGTPVQVIHHPHKAGWLNKTLYLETHEPIASYNQKPISLLNELDVENTIYHAIRNRPAKINWELVYQNMEKHLGIPTPIGYE